MIDGYDQNSDDIVFNPKEFVEDFTLRYQDSMTESMIYDLFVVVKEAYGDGFIQGFNLGVNETEDWWAVQDKDEAWIDEMSLITLQELDEYYSDCPDEELPPGSAIERRTRDE